MRELIHKRKWNRKVFDTGKVKKNHKGMEKPIYAAKIQNGLHDVEPDGSYIDIDTLFTGVTDDDETDRVGRTRCGRISISNKKDESKDRLKILTKNNCGISLKLKGYKTYGPHFDDLRSTYYTTYDGITLRYYPNYKGARVIIEIANPSTSSNIFRFVIREFGCDYTYEEVRGGIKCISSTGTDDIFIEAPYVIDGNGEFGDVSLKLGTIDINGNQIIKKVVDPVWLGNAAAPVKLDPSVTINSGDADFAWAMIRTDPSRYDRNYDGDSGTPFINYASSSDINILLAKADLSSYSGKTVDSGTARFGMNVTRNSGTSLGIEWHEVLTTWYEGSSWNTTESGAVCGRYSNYNTVLWNTIGARGDGTDRNGTADGSSTITGASDTDFQMAISDSLAQQFIDGTNYGIVIDPDVGVAAQYSINSMYYYFEYTEDTGIVFASLPVIKPDMDNPLTIPQSIPGGTIDNTWTTS